MSQLPFLPMLFHQHQSAPTGGMPENEVPARVVAAIRLVDLFRQKLEPRVAVNDMSIEWADKVELTVEEAGALESACQMLSRYFLGTLPPDAWEKARAAAFEKRPEPDGTKMSCPVCDAGPLRPMCTMCKGRGKVVITPAGG